MFALSANFCVCVWAGGGKGISIRTHIMPLSKSSWVGVWIFRTRKKNGMESAFKRYAYFYLFTGKTQTEIFWCPVEPHNGHMSHWQEHSDNCVPTGSMFHRCKKITKRMKYAAFWKTDWPTAGWSLKLCCYGKKKRVSKTLYIPHSVYKHVKQQLAPHAKQITDQPKLFLFSSLQIQAVTFCLWAPATILPNQADHFYPSCTSSIQAGVSSCCRGKSWMLRPWTLGVLQKYSLIKMTVNVHRHLSPCFRLRRMHIW